MLLKVLISALGSCTGRSKTVQWALLNISQFFYSDLEIIVYGSLTQTAGIAGNNVLKHFDISQDSEKVNFKAKCIHCLTPISGSLKVTSNFVTHMKVCTCMFINISFTFFSNKFQNFPQNDGNKLMHKFSL